MTNQKQNAFDPQAYALAKGWDFTHIEATARYGLAEPDADSLSDSDGVALLHWCRAQVNQKNERPPLDGDPIEQKRQRDEELANLHPHIEAFMGESMRMDEAESYLEGGGKFRPDGFDIRDPAVRATFFAMGKKAFIDFEINPLPEELAVRLDAIPMDWMNHPKTHPTVEALLTDIERHFQVPDWTYATLTDEKRVWIYGRP